MAASVSSLDQDMKKLRMSRYTPQAANEVRAWIEEALNERLASGDLLEALKDGIALCRLANMVLSPPGIKFKKSNMPFIQMENISHFLRACELPPLNLPAHDRFLTVDLFEGKDPAQVLQCLGAFSRVAYSVQPSRFPDPVGPKRAAAVSPSNTGSNSPFGVRSGTMRSTGSSVGGSTARGMSPSKTGGSSKESNFGGPVSSWSKKTDEGTTAPAWNIHQYGYMGGANQGTQGVAFGARRQITSAAPQVPSLAEKERMRREKADEEGRRQREEEDTLQSRRADKAAREQRAQEEEEQRWQDETRRQRDEEKAKVERQKQEWEEQERRWKADEEQRLREEDEDQKQLQGFAKKPTNGQSRPELKGQYLSDYQAQDKARSRQVSYQDPERQAEKDRVKDLERQLEEAKERERRYLQEREDRPAEGRSDGDDARSDAQKVDNSQRPGSSSESNASWAADEREFLRSKWTDQQSQRLPPAPVPTPSTLPIQPAKRPLPDPATATRPVPETPPSLPIRTLYQGEQHQAPPEPASQSVRPLPNPDAQASQQATQPPPAQHNTPRPLPDPSRFNNTPNSPNPSTFSPTGRASPFARNLPTTPSTQPSQPSQPHHRTHIPLDATQSTTAELDLEDQRRSQSQTKTKAGGYAAKSLLEREMERERERQREWEEEQKASTARERNSTEGVGPGESWDVNQYGFTGGDNQNRGGGGIGFGGRRQIIGPRPVGGRPQGPR